MTHFAWSVEAILSWCEGRNRLNRPYSNFYKSLQTVCVCVAGMHDRAYVACMLMVVNSLDSTKTYKTVLTMIVMMVRTCSSNVQSWT